MNARFEGSTNDSDKKEHLRRHWDALKNGEDVSRQRELVGTWHFISSMQLLDQEMHKVIQETPKNNSKKTLVDTMRRTMFDLYMNEKKEGRTRQAPHTSLISEQEKEIEWDEVMSLLESRKKTLDEEDYETIFEDFLTQVKPRLQLMNMNKENQEEPRKTEFKTAKQELLGQANTHQKSSNDKNRREVSEKANAKEESKDPIFSDERLSHVDPKMVELILSEIVDQSSPLTWEDIAGLDHAKKAIKEAVIWPMLRPDLFTGLRGVPKGLLLFGPPGTGKTLLGKCIASQSGATFFSISASSLTSKWIGDGEKMVRALFAVAKCRQPAVVFIDEIDSLLTQRNEHEVEATSRIKTEFLVQFDGVGTTSEDRILVIGATNRPQELDEAARRRLVKRLYIPLPDQEAREFLIAHLLKRNSSNLTAHHVKKLSETTNGYSGADITNLCKEAALNPIRETFLQHPDIEILKNMKEEEMRPITYEDFEYALTQIRASVSDRDLQGYLEWNHQFGSLG